MSNVENDNAYRMEVEAWHAARIERLTAPHGWLSLTGLEWLKPGSNRVGGAPGNDIVLSKAPACLGSIDWNNDGSLAVTLDPSVGAMIDGRVATQATLLDDSHPAPTEVAFGTVSFIAIDRGGRKGLRVRDTQAPTRTCFDGIERFPVDPAWRITAEWQPLDPPLQLTTATVIGVLEHYLGPGRAVFERHGKPQALYPVREAPGDKRLFLVFADATSGRETYGAARFLYAERPAGDTLVLDFNKAYNPPCAFTPYATCPLAPPENRLDLEVRAGEKKYREKQ